jgi:hypothetical protein
MAACAMVKIASLCIASSCPRDKIIQAIDCAGSGGWKGHNRIKSTIVFS